MMERSPEKLEQLKLILDRRHIENGTPNSTFLKRVQELERIHKWILHFNVEHVHGPEEVAYDTDELIVLCSVRDGRPYVRSFVEHYTSMGTKHLVFLDNNSTDGTVEVLKNYDNVTVLRTGLPFKIYKVAMKQYLIERFGRGRWCLCVDIDELFDYPYSDVIGLPSLLGYLNGNSYTAVAAQMLDMFPEEPLSDAASEEDEPLKERHRFYDISNVHRQYYSDTHADERDHYAYRHGLCDVSGIRVQDSKGINGRNARDHWAYRRACGTGNMLANQEIEIYRGGIQDTIFGDTPPLTKHPLVFVDETIKPMDTSPHSVSDARIADFTCVLFHYKFLNYLYKLVQRAVRQDRYGHKRHEQWLGVLEKTPNLLVKGETARELRSVNELVENQFLVVSGEYMMLLYEEERKNGIGHALRGEPGESEDATFYRAMAEAKVQSLRALRLQRHLEQLREQNKREVEQLREQNKREVEQFREQNEREVEQLREQNKREVEKLSKTLMKQRRKAQSLRKKKRKLGGQLRSMQGSRSLRLLNKLVRLRSKVLS